MLTVARSLVDAMIASNVNVNHEFI